MTLLHIVWNVSLLYNSWCSLIKRSSHSCAESCRHAFLETDGLGLGDYGCAGNSARAAATFKLGEARNGKQSRQTR